MTCGPACGGSISWPGRRLSVGTFCCPTTGGRRVLAPPSPWRRGWLLVGVWLHRSDRRRLWWVLAAGLSCIAAGDFVYALYERVLHGSAPFPSLAYPVWDVLFLALLVRLRQVEEQSDQLAALARHDGLTGIPNRRTWDSELPSRRAPLGGDPRPGPLQALQRPLRPPGRRPAAQERHH